MVPRKDASKIDALGDDSNPNIDVLSDNTPWVMNAIKSWKKVYDILECEIINYPNYSAKEDDEAFSAKLRLATHLELHKIVACPRIIPYNDLINLDLEHVEI